MGELEDYIHSLNPNTSERHILIYGSEYHLWREGKYLGVATWTQDNNVGDSFQVETTNEAGDRIREVYTADKWQLKFKL